MRYQFNPTISTDLRIEYTSAGIPTARENWVDESDELNECEKLVAPIVYEHVRDKAGSYARNREIVTNARRLADLVWYWQTPPDLELSPVTPELVREFRTNVDTWLQETRYLSDPVKKFMHPAHLRIIGMGRDILPLILRELEKRSGHWLIALEAISPINPVNPVDKTDFDLTTEAWLRWGREEGFI